VSGGRVDVVWISLGAHSWLVRCCGRLYEAVVAARDGRPRRHLYHAALQVHVDGVTSWIEMALPVHRCGRGVIAGGPVGARILGRSRWFAYEVHCWTGDSIPTVPAALAGPVCVSASAAAARRILKLVPKCPRYTWGRDEVGAGEMWNSNSLVSWLLIRAGVWADGIGPPAGGRAPGWDAGLTVAARDARRADI
jgi:hypothetical protein